MKSLSDLLLGFLSVPISIHVTPFGINLVSSLQFTTPSQPDKKTALPEGNLISVLLGVVVYTNLATR